MFTGIIEAIGKIKSIKKDKSNIIFEIQSTISSKLKPDQSVSHNGACLTITKSNTKTHYVTAVKETLDKTNLRLLKIGDRVNLERSLIFGERLDGHLVQGHIDHTSKIIKVTDQNGSRELTIALPRKANPYVVSKGSVCINGISLTISKLNKNTLRVVIIPYTLEHTNLKQVQKDDLLNVEYDILGKYVRKNLIK